jgi:hypothetical protein
MNDEDVEITGLGKKCGRRKISKGTKMMEW